MSLLNFSFANKVVWLTGSAQGIGYEIRQSFIENGATVVGFDIQPQTLEHNFYPVELDLANAADIAETIEYIKKSQPEIAAPDIFVHAAGVLKIGCTDTISMPDWLTSFNVNCHSAFVFLQSLVANFKSKPANVVVIGSNAAHVPRLNMAAYGASKAALTHFVFTYALELASFGLRANVVSPGSTDTPMLRALYQDDSFINAAIEGSASQFKLGIPLGKIAIPSDIANTVLFLASDLAGHITMQDIVVDGGAVLNG